MHDQLNQLSVEQRVNAAVSGSSRSNSQSQFSQSRSPSQRRVRFDENDGDAHSDRCRSPSHNWRRYGNDTRSDDDRGHFRERYKYMTTVVLATAHDRHQPTSLLVCVVLVKCDFTATVEAHQPNGDRHWHLSGAVGDRPVEEAVVTSVVIRVAISAARASSLALAIKMATASNAGGIAQICVQRSTSSPQMRSQGPLPPHVSFYWGPGDLRLRCCASSSEGSKFLQKQTKSKTF